MTLCHGCGLDCMGAPMLHAGGEGYCSEACYDMAGVRAGVRSDAWRRREGTIHVYPSSNAEIVHIVPQSEHGEHDTNGSTREASCWCSPRIDMWQMTHRSELERDMQTWLQSLETYEKAH